MPTDAAWRCTYREFARLVAVQSGRRKNSDGRWDRERIGAFEAHLKNLGIEI